MKDNALNIIELRANNKRRILEKLRFGPLSRAELSREIGLTKSSITSLINELISLGVLVESGQAPKNCTAGRIGTLIDINANYGFVVGIDIHRKKISVAAVDLKGDLIFKFSEKTSAFNSSEAAFEFIIENLNSYIKNSKLKMNNLLYIGVASPGPIDCENGIILSPPNFSIFNNFEIKKKLEGVYNCPVCLENNSVALALYEKHCLKNDFSSSLFVVISDGIGSALIRNGEIFRGFHGVAGELGHISIDYNGEKCECGNNGCLEKYVTLTALKKRFGFENYEDVINLAQKGDINSLEIVDFLVAALGVGLVAAVNLFDVEKIILYGEYSYKSEFICKKIEEYIRKHSIICKTHNVKVVASMQVDSQVAEAAAIPAMNACIEAFDS